MKERCKNSNIHILHGGSNHVCVFGQFHSQRSVASYSYAQTRTELMMRGYNIMGLLASRDSGSRGVLDRAANFGYQFVCHSVVILHKFCEGLRLGVSVRRIWGRHISMCHRLLMKIVTVENTEILFL